jgi:large subunit ribosomal protein L22
VIMIARASAKYVRVPPRKAREVIDLIRGEDVSRALALMDSCPRKAAHDIKKVVQSAVAAAKAQKKVELEKLYIARASVDEGPALKRFIPRAMGRATPIKKRMCHITIMLDERKTKVDSPAPKKKEKKKKEVK